MMNISSSEESFPSPAVISVENLCFNYNGEPILSKIRFSVGSGETVAIIGGNGAGKSTLMKLLLGELVPHDGEIRLFGQDVRSFRQWYRIGYVPQNYNSLTSSFPATASEVITLNLYRYLGRFRRTAWEQREKVRQIMARMGISNLSEKLVRELSGGQQQRVMIARALVNDPEVLLMDEPTSGIDNQSVEQFYDLLSQQQQETGLTIVVVTHDQRRASEKFGRILCLEEKSVVELEPAQLKEELQHKHKHPHTAGESDHV